MAAPIRVALVGFGKIARDQHAPAIAADPRFVLAGVAGPGAALDGLPRADDLEGLLALGAPFDAVAICTPPQVRAEVARQAIAAGKHVMLEKPPAATAEAARGLLAAAARAGVTVFSAWHSRYAAGVSEARRWLSQQRVTGGQISWKEDYRVWHPGQDWIWRTGGLGVFDPGINALSILTDLREGAWRVEQAHLEVPANAAMPLRAEIELRGEDGVAVHTHLDFLHEGPPEWDLVLWTDAGEMKLSRGGARLAIRETVVIDGEDREYAGLYGDFAELIAGGESDLDVAPLEIVEAALRTGQTRTAPAIEI